MKSLVFFLLIALNPLGADLTDLVTKTKEITIPGYPGAFNPSIIAWGGNYLLSFRYLPNPKGEPWLSQIGVVLLDQDFNPISTPQIVNTRPGIQKTPSQSEDARLIAKGNEIFLVYNDCLDLVNPSGEERRDMFIARLDFNNGQFVFAEPRKLIHANRHLKRFWEKNWVPFVWGQKILFGYTIVPHEIVTVNDATGLCSVIYSTSSFHSWRWGILRGGTPALPFEGEYLAFFHSSFPNGSLRSKRLRYYMGAYTFKKDPPFSITKMTSEPIVGADFYTSNTAQKQVIFPGGFVEMGPFFYVIYGKDDGEIWVATIDKERLKSALKEVKVR